MTTTNIKLHFFKTTLNNDINIDGSIIGNAFEILKERVINSTPEDEEQSLKLFNIFMLLHLGHMAISFPDSEDPNIYGFGPKITKQSFIDAPDQILRGHVFPPWSNPMHVFSINVKLQGDFTHNNNFFNYINKPENYKLKSDNYSEINLQINGTKEEALQKLRENITYYGYPPNGEKENCISYIFKILKPTYIGIDEPIKLNNIGHLSSNLKQLIRDANMVENFLKNKSSGSGESKSQSNPPAARPPPPGAGPPPPARPPAPRRPGPGEFSFAAPFGGKKRKRRNKKTKKRKMRRKTRRNNQKRKTRRKKQKRKTRRKKQKRKTRKM